MGKFVAANQNNEVNKFKLLFVASECAPIAKVGGLGDVIGGLPKALSEIGIEVKIVIPFYEAVNRRIWKPKFVFKLDKETSIYKTRLPESRVDVFLIYNERYLSRGPIYFERTAFASSKKEIDRFLFFSQAVCRLLARICADNNADKRGGRIGVNLRSSLRQSAIGWQPDVVHCNDWHAGALVKEISNWKLVIRIKNKSTQLPIANYHLPKTVFTIHNLANQGKWGGRNPMAEGILTADKITTVSSTYAKEILTPEYGEGLDGLLRKRKVDLVGILNGIDYGFWPVRQAWGRLRHRFPHFGFIARLTSQKGLDLILPLIPGLAEKEGARFYFLGQGEKRYEKALLHLAKRYPRHVYVKIGFDEKLAHKIYAESDFFLMPSLFEPSGLGQMISMRYGTIPIARATGGLKDTVKHLRTGFVFGKPSSVALLSAIKLAVEYFRSPEKLAKMRKNCLKQDFSWEKSARKYKELYKKIVISNL